MRTRTILVLLTALILASSCQNKGDVREPNVSAELTINGLSDTHWTYFSFSLGETVGSSEYCNEEQDAEWAKRTDWDFAICGDKIKTNSGDSGIGLGGVQRNTTDAFSTLEIAPTEGYLTDQRTRIK